MIPNEVRAESDWPPAVIAGAYQTGVLGVRSLKRRGVNAVCFDCNPAMHGFRSVYGPARLSPDPDKNPREWLEFMKRLSTELGSKPVLIPSSDRYVSAIGKFHHELKDSYILNPGVTMQALLAEKQSQYKLAAEHGMPMPETHRVDSLEQVQALEEQLKFPCLLKPRHFREWERFPSGHPLSHQKIAIVDDFSSLLEMYCLAKVANPEVIVQDIILGPDTSKRVYLAVYDKNSKRIAHAMFRELRCVPFGFGPASVSEPFQDPEADEVCDSFLKSIAYQGICEIEVKRDDRDGKVRLIEANPRLSGGGDAAPYDGVDICWIHYLDLIGKKVTPVAPLGRKFRHIVLRAEGTAIPEYMKAGKLSFWELLRSYKPPIAFFDFELRDWRNSLETLLVFLRLLISGTFRSGKKYR